MSQQRVASRYAKSLIDLAVEQNKLDKIKMDMDAIKSSLSNRDLYLMVKSPIIKGSKKSDILKAIFSGQLDELTLAFVDILIAKGRESNLPEIIDEFLTQYKKKLGILAVKMTTATPASEAVMQLAKEKILAGGHQARSINIKNVIDNSIIGGFKLEFEGKEYDSSVATQLLRLKNNLRK